MASDSDHALTQILNKPHMSTQENASFTTTTHRQGNTYKMINVVIPIGEDDITANTIAPTKAIKHMMPWMWMAPTIQPNELINIVMRATNVLLDRFVEQAWVYSTILGVLDDLKSWGFDYINHGVSKSQFISPMHGEGDFEFCGCGAQNTQVKEPFAIARWQRIYAPLQFGCAIYGFYLDIEEANWEVWSYTCSCPHSQCSMDRAMWTMGVVI